MNTPKLTAVFFSFLLLSCNFSKEDKFHFYPKLKDSLIHKKFIEMRLNEFENFNLSDISKGSTDSLEIRIWPNYAFDVTKNVFILKKDKSRTKGLHYNSFMLPNTTEDGNNFRKTDLTGLGDSVFVVKEFIPLCGWNKFYDSITYFRMLELPTQTDIKDFKIRPTLDGYGYAFEFATPNSYRFITYGNPNIYSYDECKLVYGFIEMLKRQLGNDFVWPSNIKVPPRN